MPWKMFLVERAPFARRSLRRFLNSQGKPVVGCFHDETEVIDDQFPCPGDENGRSTDIEGPWKDDPRWPKECRALIPDPTSPGGKKKCGYVFLPTDHFQVNEDRLWQGCPDGKLYVLREHPPGATWVSDWFPEEPPNGKWTGPDGKVWCVMLPSRMEWVIYSNSSQGGKWQVAGVPPKITVNPSVYQVGSFHCFIRDGVISDDTDGRKFPHWPSTA